MNPSQAFMKQQGPPHASLFGSKVLHKPAQLDMAIMRSVEPCCSAMQQQTRRHQHTPPTRNSSRWCFDTVSNTRRHQQRWNMTRKRYLHQYSPCCMPHSSSRCCLSCRQWCCLCCCRCGRSCRKGAGCLAGAGCSRGASRCCSSRSLGGSPWHGPQPRPKKPCHSPHTRTPTMSTGYLSCRPAVNWACKGRSLVGNTPKAACYCPAAARSGTSIIQQHVHSQPKLRWTRLGRSCSLECRQRCSSSCW